MGITLQGFYDVSLRGLIPMVQAAILKQGLSNRFASVNWVVSREGDSGKNISIIFKAQGANPESSFKALGEFVIQINVFIDEQLVAGQFWG